MSFVSFCPPCAENAAESARLNASALGMALRYNFVTPLTSLIVVQTSNLTSEDNSTTTDDNGDDGGPDEENALDASGFLVPTTNGGGGGGGGGGINSSSGSVGQSQPWFLSAVMLLAAVAVTSFLNQIN